MSGQSFAIRWPCWPASVLHLALGLIDHQAHGERLAAAAVAGAAHRGGAQVVEADGDADMGVGGADSVRRVERDPAEVLDMGLGPGMAGLLVNDAVGPVEVARHITHRNAELARRRNEHMGEVLADATLERERL